MNSLRQRLTRDVLAISALLLGGSLAALYFAARAELVEQFDAALQAKALALSAVIGEGEGRINLNLAVNFLHTSADGRAQDFFELWDTLVEIMIVVVIIGLLAAMAVPAFQKVRATAQDKSVFSNLRQLGAGANQIFLEQGVSSVASTTLVGTNSSQYVKTFGTVAGESYTATILQGTPITASGIAGQRTVTYTGL